MKAVGREGMFLVDIFFGLAMPAFVLLQVVFLLVPTLVYYPETWFQALEFLKHVLAEGLERLLSFIGLNVDFLQVLTDFSFVEFLKSVPVRGLSTWVAYLFSPLDALLGMEKGILSLLYDYSFFPGVKALNYVIGLLSSKWVVQVVWLFVWHLSWRFTSSMIDTLYPRHDSAMLYKLPFKLLKRQLVFLYRVAKKLCAIGLKSCMVAVISIFMMYQGFLASAVRILRKRNVLTELILVLIIILWIGWPVLVPYYMVNSVYLKISSWLTVIVLMVWSRSIILKNWK